ncbi:MAG: histidine kinase [Bdellovibrionota bacterium]
MRSLGSVPIARTYITEVLFATALLVILLPYTILTNFTASTYAILIQAVIFWLLTPVFIILSRLYILPQLSKINSLELLTELIVDAIGLTFSAASMLIVYHATTKEPYQILLSPYLLAALAPVYAGYVMLNLYRAWNHQRLLALHLEVAKSKAAWKALSSQIKPHFLFNSLNILEHLIGSSTEVAKECVQHLAGLYRRILESSKSIEIELEEEIETVKDYLFIQKLRFEDRLSYEINISSDVKSLYVPPNIILNCVENAIKYGIEPSEAAGKIYVYTEILNKQLILYIESPYLGVNSTKIASNGFGHAYIQENLHILYGGRGDFKVNILDNIFQVKIEIPHEKAVL